MIGAPINSFVRITASAMLALALAGCVVASRGQATSSHSQKHKCTIEDLRCYAKKDPLRKPAFQRQREGRAIEPLERDFLIGKWHRNLCTSRKSWFVTEQGIKSIESKLYYDITYEFNPDGTYVCGGTISKKPICMESEKIKTKDVGTWNYHVESGELELVRSNKRDLVRTDSKRKVVWFSLDKISLREMDWGFVEAQAKEDIQSLLGKDIDSKHYIDKWGCLHITMEEDKVPPTYSELFDTPDYWIRISPPPVVNKPSFEVVSLTYDANTRTGSMSVRITSNKYEEARKWVRKNIEMLARDKNIALTTGEIPPAAKFYLGREELKEGNVLEIEFKTE